MKVRTWMVAGAALVVAIGGAAVLLFDRAPGDEAPLHGDFEHRFQPRMEGLGIHSGDARLAGIRSIKELPPVQLPKR